MTNNAIERVIGVDSLVSDDLPIDDPRGDRHAHDEDEAPEHFLNPVT